MSTVTVNVSFQDSLLNEIDKIARNEYRSRSELIRDAARLYIQRQSQWSDFFQLGDMAVQKQHLNEHDVATEIEAVREAKASNLMPCRENREQILRHSASSSINSNICS